MLVRLADSVFYGLPGGLDDALLAVYEPFRILLEMIEYLLQVFLETIVHAAE
jgi:hypothetical protein